MALSRTTPAIVSASSRVGVRSRGVFTVFTASCRVFNVSGDVAVVCSAVDITRGDTSAVKCCACKKTCVVKTRGRWDVSAGRVKEMEREREREREELRE